MTSLILLCICSLVCISSGFFIHPRRPPDNVTNWQQRLESRNGTDSTKHEVLFKGNMSDIESTSDNHTVTSKPVTSGLRTPSHPNFGLTTESSVSRNVSDEYENGSPKEDTLPRNISFGITSTEVSRNSSKLRKNSTDRSTEDIWESVVPQDINGRQSNNTVASSKIIPISKKRIFSYAENVDTSLTENVTVSETVRKNTTIPYFQRNGSERSIQSPQLNSTTGPQDDFGTIHGNGRENASRYPAKLLTTSSVNDKVTETDVVALNTTETILYTAAEISVNGSEFMKTTKGSVSTEHQPGNSTDILRLTTPYTNITVANTTEAVTNGASTSSQLGESRSNATDLPSGLSSTNHDLSSSDNLPEVPKYNDRVLPGTSVRNIFENSFNETDTEVSKEAGDNSITSTPTLKHLDHVKISPTVTLHPGSNPNYNGVVQTILLEGLKHGAWNNQVPIEDGPFGSLIWRDKKYLISVLVPIGVGITGAVIIVIVAYAVRSYKRKLKRRAFTSPSRTFRPQAQLAIMDQVLLLDDSSDDGF